MMDDFDDIIFNDNTPDWLEDYNYDCAEDVLFHNFTQINGWDLKKFNIKYRWTEWATMLPYIKIKYIINDIEYRIKCRLDMSKHKSIHSWVFSIDNEEIVSSSDANLTTDYFLDVDSNGRILNSTEEKCVKIINKLLAMKSFI